MRSFPIAAPTEGIGLVGSEGDELAWVERIEGSCRLESRQALEEDLAGREFMPVIQRIRSVSSFATPSTWEIETDRGPRALPQVPVVVLDHLTEAQKRAYVIADNKLALNAGWDDDLLRSEMATLAAENFDLPVTACAHRQAHAGSIFYEVISTSGPFQKT